MPHSLLKLTRIQLNLVESVDRMRIYFFKAPSLSKASPMTSIGDMKCCGLFSAKLSNRFETQLPLKASNIYSVLTSNLLTSQISSSNEIP